MKRDELENLVVLMYAGNTCYTKVVVATNAQIKGLRIRPEKSIWSYRDWKNVPIGKMRTIYKNASQFGVIGVYDKTMIEHLDSMVHDAVEAMRSDYPMED